MKKLFMILLLILFVGCEKKVDVQIDTNSSYLKDIIFNLEGGADEISLRDVPSDTSLEYQLYFKESVTKNKSISFDSTSTKKYVSKKYKFDNETGKYELINPKLVNYSNKYINYYTIDSDNSSTQSNYMVKIKKAENMYTVTVDEYTVEEVDNNYLMYASLDNDGITYYYRGEVVINYVSYSNYLWRIVRINGDGSIRLILDDYIRNDNKIVISEYNRNSNCTTDYVNSINKAIECVKYGYGKYKDDSIKTVIDEWYNNNINKNLVVESNYCNDITHSNKYFSAYYRVGDTYNPSFKCQNALKLSVGLISIDEITFAGSTGDINFYLYNGDSFWHTMSPLGYMDGQSMAMNYSSGSNSSFANSVDTKLAIRPVINVKGDVLVTGRGTKINPYKIIEK